MLITKPLSNLAGVDSKVGLKIYDMLVKGRRYFGSAGASLTWHVNDPNFNSAFSRQHVQSGLSAERSTSLRLQNWIKDKPNAVLADSVHIVGAGTEYVDEETGLKEGGDTDHVLILGNTVVLVDTKRWKSRRKYAISSKGTVLRQGRSFSGGQVHAKQAKFLWQKYLGKSAKIYSFICINADKVFVVYDDNWKRQVFRLITIEQLENSLNRLYERLSAYDKTHINSSFVAQVALCCVKPYDGFKKLFGEDTLKDFR